MLFINLVQANLKTRLLGQKIEYYTRLESTNSEAWELIREGAKSGTLVVTDNQFKGKGREDRVWSSAPDKGITFSLVLFTELEAKLSGWFPILTGVAVHKALSSFHSIPMLKWPNDLILGGKKVGGILCESKVKHNRLHKVVIGVGLNVNETIEDFDVDLRSSATSMHIHASKFYQRERVLAEILNNLEPLIDGLPNNLKLIKSQWESTCDHLGSSLQFHNQNSIVKGVFKSLGSSGSAIIDVDGENTEFHSAEIS